MKNLHLTISVFLFIALSSCGQVSRETSNQHKYTVEINKEDYVKDSMYLYYVLETALIKNISPFTPAATYLPSSKIHVDSILYSPDKMRLVVFVITKVQFKDEANNLTGFKYNARYLFCDREKLSHLISVYQYCPLLPDDFPTLLTARTDLRNEVFFRRSSKQWNATEPKYNMDDQRFWNSNEFALIRTSKELIKLDEQNSIYTF